MKLLWRLPLCVALAMIGLGLAFSRSGPEMFLPTSSFVGGVLVLALHAGVLRLGPSTRALTTRRPPSLSTMLLLAVSAHANAATPCAIAGERVQWAADACMLALQTDDEIAASDCIAVELARPYADDCAAKAALKRAMCERIAVAACVDDPGFMGHTVRNGGVGTAGTRQ